MERTRFIWCAESIWSLSLPATRDTAVSVCQCALSPCFSPSLQTRRLVCLRMGFITGHNSLWRRVPLKSHVFPSGDPAIKWCALPLGCTCVVCDHSEGRGTGQVAITGSVKNEIACSVGHSAWIPILRWFQALSEGSGDHPSIHDLAFYLISPGLMVLDGTDWAQCWIDHSPIMHNHTPHTLHDAGSDGLSSSSFLPTAFKNMYIVYYFSFFILFLMFAIFKIKT